MPGDGGAMPDGELIAPDVTDASALAQLSSDPGMWPSAGYVFLGATWPAMLPPAGGGGGGGGDSGDSTRRRSFSSCPRYGSSSR